MLEIKSEISWNRYLRFIDFARSKPAPSRFENHHIIPRSLGGNNDGSNIVALSPRQHFIAHWLLWKAIDSSKLASAFFLMSNRLKLKRGRSYSDAKDQHAKKISNIRFGKSHSEETKRKISIGNSNKVLTESQRKNFDRTGISHSEETKRKISEAFKGRRHSEETKRKIGAGQKDKVITEAGKQSQRDAVSKEYEFLNPNGEVVRIKNLTAFCNMTGLSRFCMTELNKGERPDYKGWKLPPAK